MLTLPQTILELYKDFRIISTLYKKRVKLPVGIL
jgi:hypothetical protein